MPAAANKAESAEVGTPSVSSAMPAPRPGVAVDTPATASAAAAPDEIPGDSAANGPMAGDASGLSPDAEAYWRALVLARVQGVFAEAILTHAGQASSPGRYYRRLLAALDGQAPIDLAALAAGSGDKTASEPPRETGAPSLSGLVPVGRIECPPADRSAPLHLPAAPPPGSPGALGERAAAIGEAADERGQPLPAAVPPPSSSLGNAGRDPAGLPSRAWLEQSLANGWNAVGLVLGPMLARPELVAGMVQAWPDGLLASLLAYLRKDDFLRLQPYADTLTAAWVREDGENRRRRHWQFLAAALFPAVRFTSVAAFVTGYADVLAAAAGAGRELRAELCARLPESPERKVLHQHIRYWLLGRGAAPLPDPSPAAMEPEVVLPGGGLVVGNAGQVLAAPYMPRLFGMLGLLEKGQFIAPEHARRACHLLQFMVDARGDAPEHQLALNKLLCGLDLRLPLEACIEVSEAERSAIEGMLKAIIANWGGLGKTSIAGLRETFLQRRGALSRQEEGWQLKVEQKTVDVLMDRLPWGFSVIRHTWMKQAVMVEWR